MLTLPSVQATVYPVMTPFLSLSSGSVQESVTFLGLTLRVENILGGAEGAMKKREE